MKTDPAIIMKTILNKNYTQSIILWIIFASLFHYSCDRAGNKQVDHSSGFSQFLAQKPNAQQLDSLYNIVTTLPNDSSKVDILLMIYKNSIRKKPVRHDILDTAMFLAKNMNYLKGIAIAYDRKGLNSRYGLKYHESVEFHKLALQYYNRTTDTLGTIKCLNSLGVSLRRLNNEREAMKYYLEALKLSEAINHTKSVAVALNGIGNVFVNIGQYKNAMPYFKQALAIEVKAQNKRGINYGLSNIGEVFMFQYQYDSAIYYYNKALAIAKVINYKDNESINYNCIGHYYQQIGDFQKSNENYLLAIPKLEKYNGKRYLSNTLISLGVNYTHLDKYELAFPYLNRGLKMAKEINSPENIVLGFEALSDYYEKTAAYNLALINFKNAITLRDSIKAQEVKQNIASLESIYENELKDKEIKNFQFQVRLQKNQNITQWVIIVFLLLLLASFLAFYHLRRDHNRLLIKQMRDDIQEYIQRIEKYEDRPEEEEKADKEADFAKNVERYGLTHREVDVLSLISQGLKNEEIAEKLFVSLSTIKTHTKNIFVKLDVRNRIEAARKTKVI